MRSGAGRLAQWSRRLAGALLLLVLAAWGALHAALNLGPVEALVSREGRCEAQWRSAWMLWPGTLHLRGVNVRGRDTRRAWDVAADTLDVQLRLRPLLARRLEVRWARAHGGRVWMQLRNRHLALEQRGPTPPLLAFPAPAVPRTRIRWALALDGLEAAGVRDVWIGPVRYVGEAALTGLLHLEARETLRDADLHVRLGPGALLLGGSERMGTVRGATVQVRMPARGGGDPRRPPYRERWSALEADADGELALEDLGFLTPLLQRSPALPLQLSGGRGTLQVQLRTRGRQLLPGTRVEGSGRAARLVAPFGSLQAGWSLRAGTHETRDGDGRTALRLWLAPVELQTAAGERLGVAPALEGRLLLGRLAWRVRPALQRLTLRTPEPGRLDARLLNRWTQETFEVLGGVTRFHVDLAWGPGVRHPEPALSLLTEGLQVRWGEARLSGRLELVLDVQRLRVHAQDFDLSGTRVSLSNLVVVMPGQQFIGWDGALQLPTARLQLSPPRFEGQVQGRLEDAAPFVALLSEQGKLPRVFAPLLQARDLQARADVSFADAGTRARELQASTRALRLEGELGVQDREDADALLLLHLGAVGAAVEVGPAGREVHLVRPTHWYRERKARRSASR